MKRITAAELAGHGTPTQKADRVTQDIFLNYAYALLTIAGADGDVSDNELKYLIHKVRLLGATEEVVKKITQFDWRNAKLEDLIAALSTADVGGNCARALLYDAIKVSRADGTFDIAERQAVHRTARLLGLDPNIADAINGVIELEESGQTILRGLLESSL